MALDVITTTAGRAAILDAVASSGTVTVQDCLISDTNQAVSQSTTSLSSVVATLTNVVGSVRPAGAGNALHVVVKDDSSASYTVRAFALRLTSGTILMVYSQSGAIATKASDSTLLLAFDWTIDADTAATIDFGDTDFALPSASTTTPGVVELATNAETQAGADALRAVTPASLASLTALDTRRGLVELADLAELAANDATRAVTPFTLQARVNGLSSDLGFTGQSFAWTGTHRYTDHEKLRYNTAQVQWVPVPLPSVQYDGFPTPSIIWSMLETNPMLFSLANSKRLWIPLKLPNGATVDQFKVGLTPGASRASTANRMQVDVWERNSGVASAPSKLSTSATDNGSAGAQVVTLNYSLLINNTADIYWLSVMSGNTGATQNDFVFSVLARCQVTYPLKR